MNTNSSYQTAQQYHTGPPQYAAQKIHNNHNHNNSSNSNNSNNNGNQRNDRTPEDPALMLFIEDVESGQDTRTSLMVRNIPNKYTQRMFLDEIRAGGHGDKIDFFYLPIDFKNKCNRGYAFINFIKSSDIGPFFRQYSTKPWKNFNSEKLCAIKYARIQGKVAMIKRFENSALMEKEDEFRPLVFDNKGELEEFPCIGAGGGSDRGSSHSGGGGGGSRGSGVGGG